MTLTGLFELRRWLWRLLVLEAMVWLMLGGLALRLLSFRRLAPLLGPSRPPGAAMPPASAEDIRLARRVGAAVSRGARALPWKPVCLPQAMAAKAMLSRRHVRSVLYLGAMPGGGGRGITAHAWLMLGSTPVTGGAIRSDYAELACFG